MHEKMDRQLAKTLAMIAKISSGKSFIGVIQYNELKVEEKKGALLSQNKMPNYRNFQAAEFLRRNGQYSRVKKQVFHVSLSFSEEDKAGLTDTKMKEIGNKYMEQMGMSNHPYLIYRHDDTDHPHMHIVASKIHPISGKKVIEKNDRYKSKRITSELEKVYQLKRTSELGKGISNAKFNKITKDVKNALYYAPTSYAQLNKRLEKNGSSFRLKGVGSGMIYYRVGKDGKQNSASWKGSLFKNQGIDKQGLKNEFELSKNEATQIRHNIELIFKGRGGNNKIRLAEFEKGLLKKEIETKFSIGDKGNVYGLSYKYNGKEFKASSISRDLSWNKMKTKLLFPNDMRLREELKRNVEENKHIHIKVDTDKSKKYHFTSGNDYINAALNNMENTKALSLAENNNDHVKINSEQRTYPEFRNVGVATNKIVAHLSMTETDHLLHEKENSILRKKNIKRL